MSLFILLALLVTGSLPVATAQEQVPSEACRLRVLDEARLYSDDDEAFITRELCLVESDTGARVYLMTLDEAWEEPQALTERLDRQLDANTEENEVGSVLLLVIRSYGPSGLPALWLHADPRLEDALGQDTLRRAERGARNAGSDGLDAAGLQALAIIVEGLRDEHADDGFPELAFKRVAPGDFWKGTLAFTGMIAALAVTASVLRRPGRP